MFGKLFTMYMQLIPKNCSKGKHTNIVLTRNDLSLKLKTVMARQHTIVYIYII